MNFIGEIAKILLFYVFFQTLHDATAKRQQSDGLIGSNPGLEFSPMPPDGSTLIWYKSSDKGNIHYWQTRLDNFLKPYKEQENADSATLQDCDNIKKPDEGKFCKFKLQQSFAPCLKDYGYGFGSPNGGPCIYLKLNKIYGWLPEYYNTTTTVNSGMPQHLQEHIKEQQKLGNHHLVWVDCAGENPADVETIGPISYHPDRGFHDKYFPFKNITGYLSPLVAVHFENPKRGVLINIECKLWARNLVHDQVHRRGSVHFELTID